MHGLQLPDVLSPQILKLSSLKNTIPEGPIFPFWPPCILLPLLSPADLLPTAEVVSLAKEAFVPPGDLTEAYKGSAAAHSRHASSVARERRWRSLSGVGWGGQSSGYPKGQRWRVGGTTCSYKFKWAAKHPNFDHVITGCYNRCIFEDWP